LRDTKFELLTATRSLNTLDVCIDRLKGW
jgi:hypothetical protein